MQNRLQSHRSDWPKLRLWPLPIILSVGAVLFLVTHVAEVTIIKPVLDFFIIVGLVDVALYVWLRAWSRLTIAKQSVVAVLLIAVQAFVVLTLRVDGFDGNGRFITKWRWNPTPEVVLANFRSEEIRSSSVADLSNPSSFDSPSFRGCKRDGRYDWPELKFDWTGQAPIELWRRPVGRGWSSFAVVGDYCITQEQLSSNEAITCYELLTGRPVWQYSTAARFDEVSSGPGPRATPTVHNGNVFALGATGIVSCINGTNGERIWEKDLCQNKSDEILFGFASSPLIDGSNVIVSLGLPDAAILALDIESGETVWSAKGDKPGYSSPQLFNRSTDHSVLNFDATGLHSYDPMTGGVQWSFEWGDNSDDQVNVCQPAIINSSQVLISSGYGRGAALLQVSRSNATTWKVTELWQTKRLKSKFASVVVLDGFAFGLDEGILTCINLQTGARQWKNGRYGHGQLVLLNDLLFVQGESGQMAVVRADSAKFDEIAKFAALSDRTWNHPVISGPYLLVRNDREAACFKLPVVKSAQ